MTLTCTMTKKEIRCGLINSEKYTEIRIDGKYNITKVHKRGTVQMYECYEISPKHKLSATHTLRLKDALEPLIDGKEYEVEYTR